MGSGGDAQLTLTNPRSFKTLLISDRTMFMKAVSFSFIVAILPLMANSVGPEHDKRYP